MSKSVSIQYNSMTYSLRLDKRHDHLNSNKVDDGNYDINKDDIVLSPGLRVSEYKKLQEVERIKQNSSLKALKFLDEASLRDFSISWSQLMETRKKELEKKWKNAFLDPGHVIHQSQLKNIHEVADNGMVFAMYCLGVFYSASNNPDAIEWFVRAHNSGHLGAAYELAVFMDRNLSYSNCLKCLIASADNGLDHAFMSIFHPSIILALLETKKVENIHTLLDQFISSTSYSTARYLKSICHLLDSEFKEAFQLLNECTKHPQNPLGTKGWIEKDNQNKLVGEYLTRLKSEVFRNRKDFLKKLVSLSQEYPFISFKDYCEFYAHFRTNLAYM